MTAHTTLVAHSYYRQSGGEDSDFRAESELLRSRGHEVVTYEDDNRRIRSGAVTGLVGIWNQAGHTKLSALIRSTKPAVAHFHNTFPLISPAAYYAARALQVPVLQKISNYRLLCPGALLLRNGQICRDCVEADSFRPAIRHRCYRGSLGATAAVASMLRVHRSLGTWTNAVDLYVAVTESLRQEYIRGGFPEDQIAVKPQFVKDRGVGHGQGGNAVYVGRLSEEKGPAVLNEAWAQLPDLRLLVAGSGPLQDMRWNSGVQTLGQQSRDEVHALMAQAAVLIVPSICLDAGPLTMLEAFSCGTPVIAADIGGMAERIRDGYNGLLFRAGDAEDLAAKVRYVFDHPEHLAQMRINARREYEEKYTPERNYKMLMAIYEQAIENAQRRRRKAS